MPSAADTQTDQRNSKIPPPVRAGIGLVAAGVDKARHVDVAGLATLPLRGLGALGKVRGTVERTYEELTSRGETVVARLRGKQSQRNGQANGQATAQAAAQAAEPAPTVAEMQEAVEQATDPFGLPEEVAQEVADATPGATLTHDQLPLEDYDHLTLGSLRARLPRLDAVALVQLRDYERAHANRLPVLTMLENRIAKIANGA